MNHRRRIVAAAALALVGSSLFGSPAAAQTPGTVLITGASRGIGLELARQYAARGWTVFATARKPAEALALGELAAANPKVAIETLDVADHASIDRLAAKLANQPLDVLIHNAGVSGGAATQVLGRMKYDVFREVLEVNTIGPMKLTEALLPNLVAGKQKKLVLISTSEASFARINAGRLYWYRASKAAANMLMLNLAYELQGRKIAVGIVNPGPVDTDMMKGVRMPLQPPAEAVAKVIAIIDRLELAQTGKFWDYDGGELPW
ncbi:MAG: SDR family oxidoreductase [Steroidobacteraceae bacterium]|nr:SDR family oxidoreductase [Steroidobacteraceae bacterium]